MVRKYVRLSNAAIDETPDGGIVFRGVLDPDTLQFLNCDDYQREVGSLTSIKKLMKAFREGKVPDIEIGMRGQDYTTENGSVILRDPVYIVDGLQRVTAALQLLKQPGEVRPHLGAAVHFDTNQEWERDRFKILNQDRKKLSPNVLLRNEQHKSQGVAVIYRLTTAEPRFVLNARITWTQNMHRGELLTALTICQVVNRLHYHLGGTMTSSLDDVARGLDKILAKVGEKIMTANTDTFFNLVNDAFGIRNIVYREGAAYMRNGFLSALARVLSDHEDFWEGNRLVVSADIMRKIGQFPIHDPMIIGLSTSSGKGMMMMHNYLVDHINRGKRTKRLTPRRMTEADFHEES